MGHTAAKYRFIDVLLTDFRTADLPLLIVIAAVNDGVTS